MDDRIERCRAARPTQELSRALSSCLNIGIDIGKAQRSIEKCKYKLSSLECATKRREEKLPKNMAATINKGLSRGPRRTTSARQEPKKDTTWMMSTDPMMSRIWLLDQLAREYFPLSGRGREPNWEREAGRPHATTSREVSVKDPRTGDPRNSLRSRSRRSGIKPRLLEAALARGDMDAKRRYYPVKLGDSAGR